LRHAYTLISNKSYTDDSEVYSSFFNKPFTIDGEITNKKITFDNDLFGINAKVGVGYDLHKLQKGLPFILGGKKIPHNKGFIAHSDGDVLIHSIMDALLGMVCERDIGIQFPDTQIAYKDISSMVLLKKVKQIINNKNTKINNICCVIIAEEPKLSEYIPYMIQNIAKVLEIETTQISINTTTNEKIGIIGKEQAVAVYTVCSGF
jgi:2-C-methyl-D-erythritol 2,4-cyclodiphosphate synthase